MWKLYFTTFCWVWLVLRAYYRMKLKNVCYYEAVWTISPNIELPRDSREKAWALNFIKIDARVYGRYKWYTHINTLKQLFLPLSLSKSMIGNYIDYSSLKEIMDLFEVLTVTLNLETMKAIKCPNRKWLPTLTCLAWKLEHCIFLLLYLNSK